ncbi:MAG: gamma-glutamyltransferase [Pseudomonadota bacterium]
MLRRNFISSFSSLAVLSGFGGACFAQNRGGDRITGAQFASRSTVWGVEGAAATAHPIATLIGIEILKKGGSAIDAAIAINAALGFLEPIACGIGGDAYCIVNDPQTGEVLGFNGSGRSPSGMSLELVRSRAINGHMPAYGVVPVSIPGTVDAWGKLHARWGKLPFADVLAPAIELAERGVPIAQNIAHYLAASARRLRCDLPPWLSAASARGESRRPVGPRTAASRMATGIPRNRWLSA